MTVIIDEGDCLDKLNEIEENQAHLVYLDPPFFTERKQKLKNKDRSKEFSFDDMWGCHKKYAAFLYPRLEACRRVLSDEGNILVHCDTYANHVIRAMLDDIFGEKNFRSEIIWHYKRWSNSKKGLLPAHQTILWYSKSEKYHFNRIFNNYSESTNIDQILQRRKRDKDGKTVYDRDKNGKVLLDDEKQGVPLSDVWEIPYLNPKAKERVGYPTQKPLLLSERILEVFTNPGDLVIDPFCGSGTTLVCAQMLDRKGIGFDISKDAVEISRDRLKNPVKSESNLLKKGRDSYLTADKKAISILEGLDLNPIHRNKGIDGILKKTYQGSPVFIRVQRDGEDLFSAATALDKAAIKKGSKISFLVRTQNSEEILENLNLKTVKPIDSTSLSILKHLGQ